MSECMDHQGGYALSPSCLVCLKLYWEANDAELRQRIAELERLHAPMVRFVQEALDLSLDGCGYDGYEIQEDLHRYGLLEQQTMTEACDYCRCARYAGFPTQCYRVIPEFIAAREALKEAGDE